jgi:hypothetical protein
MLRGEKMSTKLAKQADLAGPGIGNYDELEKILPQDYCSLLNRKDTQRAITAKHLQSVDQSASRRPNSQL